MPAMNKFAAPLDMQSILSWFRDYFFYLLQPGLKLFCLFMAAVSGALELPGVRLQQGQISLQTCDF